MVQERIEHEKKSQKVSLVTELRSEIEELELGLYHEKERRGTLEKVLGDKMKLNAFTDTKSIHEFFGRLVEARDQQILKLEKNIENVRVSSLTLH